MSDDFVSRARYGEPFWRAHHVAWRRSDLNQREYCEAQGIPLKAFGNWRAKFKAEPQLQARKLLYRRGGVSHPLSHPLSHSLSHALSHVTYPSSSSPLPGPVVPPARDGHRRRFSEVDRCRISVQWRFARPGALYSAIQASMPLLTAMSWMVRLIARCFSEPGADGSR